MIPFFGLDRQYAELREEILDVTDQVLKSGKVLQGLHVDIFEKAIAARCKRKFAVAVNSGTQALIFAQTFLNQGADHKILIPNVSYIATLNSVLLSNNTPVFCDVDYQGQIDLESLPYKFNEYDIKGIMYVNLFGNMVDYEKLTVISKFFNDVDYIIEDAAQSFGASYKNQPSGSFGDISILSFDPTKNLPNYGSGGMLLTDNFQAYEFFLDMRHNGVYSGNAISGTNSKMSETDCAQMLIKLRHFDKWQQRRSKIAAYYMQELYSLIDFETICIQTVEPNLDVKHAWHKFVIRSTNRNLLQSFLTSKNIETKCHYYMPLSDHEVANSYYQHDLPYSSQFCNQCLSLPIYPELTDSEVQHIVDAMKLFHRRRKNF